MQPIYKNWVFFKVCACYSTYALYHVRVMAQVTQAIAHACYNTYALLKIRENKNGVTILAPQLGAVTPPEKEIILPS